MKASPITKKQLTHIVKVAVYAGISAGLAGIVALIASNPVLFGALTPVINILVVTLEKVFTSAEA
jgi:hypothetical protein